MFNQNTHFWIDKFSLFDDRRVFSFYVLLPIILGLFFAFSQAGSEPLNGLGGHVVYWLLSTFLSWQLLAIGSRIAAYILHPLGTPLLVVLIIGFVIGISLWVPVSQFRDAFVVAFLQEDEIFRGVSRYSDLSVAISNWVLGLFLWISANIFYLWFAGMTRFGYQPDTDRVQKTLKWLLSGEKDVNHFLLDTKGIDTSGKVIEQNSPRMVPSMYERLKAASGDRVLALGAQDHYTRVVLSSGEELVYIRFSDAIKEMEGQIGFQVHRSYWVSLDAAEHYWENGHRAFIKLSNKQIIPVSRSFRHIVKQNLSN
jgi:hypothetical protein